MLRKQQGFSLVEVLVVIVIIGIISAVAIPVYRTYITRARLTDALAVADSWKLKVSNYYLEQEKLPDFCGTKANGNTIESSLAEATAPTSLVAKIRWCNTTSAIEVTLSDVLGPGFTDKQIWIKADNSSKDFIKWTCGTSVTNPIECKYLPSSCNMNCSET